MTPDVLKPSMELPRQEYVLVQAWKKTSNYIRYHNWYADTLQLDQTTVNLPGFLRAVTQSIDKHDQWESDPLRLVPAPKRQQWRVSPDSGAWGPAETGPTKSPLRPLAHVSLRDQVVATAVMLCLADRVETKQGDTTRSIHDAETWQATTSYGNRLFCDSIGSELRHRWGSAKLYRAYFEDYRAFISRPSIVAKAINNKSAQRVFIVESDLQQFYDRVRPCDLTASLASIQHDSDESAFFAFASKVLNWRWHPDDLSAAAAYARKTGIGDFSQIALPQGLVSSGFFANVILLAFDEVLRREIGQDIARGIRVEDACRYVDDIRVVVAVDSGGDVENVRRSVAQWLQSLLANAAPRLSVAEEKTMAAEYGGSERPFVRQSIKMKRIQTAVSGGFDAVAGAEILDAIQGLMRSQEALSGDPTEGHWQFSPRPDVRDETVARFSAGRFRTTYRSVRPLLEGVILPDTAEESDSESERIQSAKTPRSQQDLDEDARAFALGLIERWVEDPSNVRLLRIGFDIWPDAQVLKAVLSLLGPFTKKDGPRGNPRRVAWYCLAEIFRAAATETGLVDDREALPKELDLCAYREVLRAEAARLIQQQSPTIPWYLRQQALLFQAVYRPDLAPVARKGTVPATRDYRQLIICMRGDFTGLTSTNFATFAVLMRRAFLDGQTAVSAVLPNLDPTRKSDIALRDPSFAQELYDADSDFFNGLPKHVREDFGFDSPEVDSGMQTLTNLVLKTDPVIPIRNELSLLSFASHLLRKLRKSNHLQVIIPSQVHLACDLEQNFPEPEQNIATIVAFTVIDRRADPAGSMYSTPSWCTAGERWRIQLGFLLRFILARHPDFTTAARPGHWKERSAIYRPVKSHWYQRLYGFFNGQRAFGDDWLPITDWMERLLSALLRWPGSRTPDGFDWVDHGIANTQKEIEERIKFLNEKRGPATGSLLLPMVVDRPNPKTAKFRACVVQTVVPTSHDLVKADITLSKPDIRRRHRNHLSAALAAVRQMLYLRKTHMQDDDRLDWLILPELAVHPSDIQTHLIPFSRAHKTLILTGMTYENLLQNNPPINSALWIIPEWSESHGWQIQTRRQGKLHLAKEERALNLLRFRPCQWLIGFPWSDEDRPLWITASVCFDGTDLRLASDLRNESDIFAIPAFNKDVKTFDQMALALNYHMFQLVVLANNGEYGGSSAYWPRHRDHQRQVFHLHGQPQASIAFFEIEDIGEYLARGNCGTDMWKHPPAGWTGPNSDS